MTENQFVGWATAATFIFAMLAFYFLVRWSEKRQRREIWDREVCARCGESTVDTWHYIVSDELIHRNCDTRSQTEIVQK